MEAPETRYVAVGDADVAYQVVGDGPIDLLFCWGFGSHIDLAWDEATTYPQLFRGLASFSRLIFFAAGAWEPPTLSRSVPSQPGRRGPRT